MLLVDCHRQRHGNSRDGFANGVYATRHFQNYVASGFVINQPQPDVWFSWRSSGRSEYGGTEDHHYLPHRHHYRPQPQPQQQSRVSNAIQKWTAHCNTILLLHVILIVVIIDTTPHDDPGPPQYHRDDDSRTRFVL